MLVQFDKKWYTPKEVGEIIGKSAVRVSRLFKGKDGVIDLATEHRPDAHNRAHHRFPRPEAGVKRHTPTCLMHMFQELYRV